MARERRSLAGDQFYIDLDLTKDNLPPGSQLALGTAIVAIPSVLHLGCKKFAMRFGVEAAKFVNSRRGKQLNLRGINARLIKPGVVRIGDTARRLS